jgi:hypothetical protein
MTQIYVQGEFGCPTPVAASQALAGVLAGDADDQAANQVPYDNANSGLAATDVQGALDALAAALATIPTADKDNQVAAQVPYSNAVSGLAATEVQGALDALAAMLTLIQQTPAVVILQENARLSATGPGPYPKHAADPVQTAYSIQVETFTVDNVDPVRTLYVQLMTNGSMHLGGAPPYNVNMLHTLKVDGALVADAFEQNEVGSGPETSMSGTTLYAFTVPPGDSVALAVENRIQVYSGQVNGVSSSRIHWSWQGLLV